MTINKAIEILNCISPNYRARIEPDEMDAIKLGIEALKFVRAVRGLLAFPIHALLCGETKDV